MEIGVKNESAIQAAIVAFLISVIFFLLAITLVFVNNDTIDFNLFEIGQVILHNFLVWIFLALMVILPLTVFLIFKSFKIQVSRFERKLSFQDRKSRSISRYISKLINEDFSAEVDILDEDDDLTNTLIDLRNTLKKNKETSEKQRQEDVRRNWHAEGMAALGEQLRKNTDNIEILSFNVLKNVTDYVNAIQGGFYLLTDNENKKVFELISFYAYGRKKFADKIIDIDKGLVGTSATEKKTIHINKIPSSYISVTSGLGQANPKELLIVPMIFENELFGVIEIASLNSFTSDYINFVEKSAESISSVISSVRINTRTAQLLEESKEQALALASQEEEMRQNMEELQATQEEATRQAERFIMLESTVNHTMIRAEYNINGTIIYANTRFLEKLEYKSNSEVEGKNISLFIAQKDSDWFSRIWHGLATGGRHFEGYMKHITKSGKDLWTMATYTCIRDEEGEAVKILFLALDTTEHKKISLNLEGVVDAVNRSSLKIEFDITGNIKTFNEHYTFLFKYTDRETERLNVFDLVDPMELEAFNKKWENIVRGMNFQGQFKVRAKDNKECYMRGAFSAVLDMYGEVDKVIFIGQDITNEKIMEIEFKLQNEILKNQEKLLKESEKELSRKLREAKAEMLEQFKEIESIKIRNERTLEGALDAIVTTTSDNLIVFFNQAAELLTGYQKDEVMGKDISILFSPQSVLNNDFVKSYVNIEENKIVGSRTEVQLRTKSGVENSVLILLSKAKVEDEITYTAFIQTIEVELF